jgi:hypothetical protein
LCVWCWDAVDSFHQEFWVYSAPAVTLDFAQMFVTPSAVTCYKVMDQPREREDCSAGWNTCIWMPAARKPGCGSNWTDWVNWWHYHILYPVISLAILVSVLYSSVICKRFLTRNLCLDV